MWKASKLTLVLLAVLAALVGHSVMALRSRLQHSPNSFQKNVPTRDREKPDFVKQFPSVEYDLKEPNDSRHEERKNKSKRYDNFGLVRKQSSSEIKETVRDIKWQERVAAIPASQSSAVVVGEVQNAISHLSNDKS